jgi:hypothetical protein
MIIVMDDGGDCIAFLANDPGLTADGMPSATWSTRFGDAERTGVSVLDLFLAGEGLTIGATHVVTRTESKPDIRRKRYSTSIGPVTLHTRGHPDGSEAVLESGDPPRFIYYLWQRSTSRITEIRDLDALPF